MVYNIKSTGFLQQKSGIICLHFDKGDTVTMPNNSKGGCDITQTLEDAIKKSIANGTTGGLLHISIDNLPMVISSQGGEYSEAMIGGVIEQISKILKKDDVIVRHDRNNLNILLQDYSLSSIKEIALRIHNLIQNYGCISSLEPIQITATIGSVDFPKSTKIAADAINKAYIALNDAHEMHRHYVEYKNEKAHEIESRNQMILASYLQNAFLSNKLCLAFQPIIDSRSGEISYYESLLRIINIDGSASSAGPFIPIAEKMGFMDVIDIMVFKMVIDELVRSPELKLSVNLSNASMNDSKWLASAVKLLTDNDVAKRLVVEITETSEQHDIKNVAKFVSTIQEMGCEVALDDFGTGYTSFSQLKSLPVDIIKIDGSFVRDIATNPKNKFFVKTLMEFSKNFELKAVAEFVENQETADILKAMDVDFLQGNYFSPAVTYRDWN
jgi:EAL domain-containing protein (putative c-di-GMP-specific phosphodiesterase class I)/GGDEF domain-containing protein